MGYALLASFVVALVFSTMVTLVGIVWVLAFCVIACVIGFAVELLVTGTLDHRVKPNGR